MTAFEKVIVGLIMLWLSAPSFLRAGVQAGERAVGVGPADLAGATG